MNSNMNSNMNLNSNYDMSEKLSFLDKDLKSLQDVRNRLKVAHNASLELAKLNQEQLDKIVASMAAAARNNAQMLAKMAVEETGFGVYEDKIIKNVFASSVVYDSIKNMKTIGILSEDVDEKIIEIGVSLGVIAALIPSTNPTSTVIYKALISLKSGNAIVFSPHPNASKCIRATINVLIKAAMEAGCPAGAIGVMAVPTLEGTRELMSHEHTALILATGGPQMVKAAYSSGTPAIGVGAGNGPSFIDETADLSKAVKRILDSKTFDNGTICASEQSVVCTKKMESVILAEFAKQGAYLLDEVQSHKLEKVILRADGTMNPQIVGRSVAQLVEMAKLENVPKSAKILIAREDEVGIKHAYSHEKLGLILAFYVEETVDDVLKRCQEILHFEGAGHTFSIHAQNDDLVKGFAAQIPASRILVNTGSALGGIGATSNLFPALTLGCGAIGGSSSSENISPMELINVKHVAYGCQELANIKDEIFDGCHCNHKSNFKSLDLEKSDLKNLDLNKSEVEKLVSEIMKVLVK